MKRSGQLSVSLHVLLHMAQRDEALTSEQMAACAGTHAVVIRRTFGRLREAGIVSSVKGHGGGWRLARPAAEISLADVQSALGERIFHLAAETPGCLVEHAVHRALDAAMDEANQLLERRFASITLADLAADVGEAYSQHFPHHESSHPSA
ncbi:MAG: Rrf2 family transcriptional regulator [Luteolibacter sp.]